jgi:hypothetical protein
VLRAKTVDLAKKAVDHGITTPGHSGGQCDLVCDGIGPKQRGGSQNQQGTDEKMAIRRHRFLAYRVQTRFGAWTFEMSDLLKLYRASQLR